MNLEDRYQLQPWYIKLWRRRYYLAIPYNTFKSWWRSLEGSHQSCTLVDYFSISIGMADMYMNWVYTLEEMNQRMEEAFKKHENNK